MVYDPALGEPHTKQHNKSLGHWKNIFAEEIWLKVLFEHTSVEHFLLSMSPSLTQCTAVVARLRLGENFLQVVDDIL